MRIVSGSVVTLAYQVTSPDEPPQGFFGNEVERVSDGNGEVILDSGATPLVFCLGAADEGLFPALEDALLGLTIGSPFEVHLSPEQAFGLRDPALVRLEPLSHFTPDVAEKLEVGGQLELAVDGEGDGGEVRPFWVVERRADAVVLDGNPLLAGMRLVFSGTVVMVENGEMPEPTDPAGGSPLPEGTAALSAKEEEDQASVAALLRSLEF